jgi:hypothetical protein
LNTLEKANLIYGKSTDNERLDFAVKRANEIICGYCNINEITDDSLDDICAEIAADIYSRECDGEKLKSISEGDVSMTFLEDVGYSYINNYKAKLEKFRRLKWN